MTPFNIPIEKLPENGLLMAYFKDRLVFETYEVKDGRILCESSALLENELPEEGHFFNETVEYRFVVRKSRKDVIELLLTEDEEKKMDPDLLFYDEGIVREEFSAKEGMPRRLRVINRYRYSENDTLVLNNYRLSM